MKKFKTLSIIIPAFNEEDFIEKVLKRVLNSKSYGLKKQIIVVNDGSTDKTLKILKKIKDKRIRLINKRKNEGKGAAVRSALKKATGDIIVIQDADLEYNPDEYSLLLKPILEGQADVVYGSRELNKNNKYSHLSFYVGGKLLTLITNVLYGSNLTDEPTGYKVFKRGVLIDLPIRLKN